MRHFYYIILSALLLLPLSCSGKTPVKRYRAEVVSEYPHSRKSYTQGLFFSGSELYESTGLHGESRLMRVDLHSGKPLQSRKLARKYFGEGSVELGGKIYLLTWQNKVAFVYDADSLRYEKTWSYPREGWGLTTDGKSLIASDGTSKIYFLSADFALDKTLEVKLNGRPLRNLNELEWIDGRIWANVYTTDFIAIINPSDGNVEGLVDCSGLLKEELRKPDTDVLNGIALSPDGKIYLTGKNWPLLFEVRLKKTED